MHYFTNYSILFGNIKNVANSDDTYIHCGRSSSHIWQMTRETHCNFIICNKCSVGEEKGEKLCKLGTHEYAIGYGWQSLWLNLILDENVQRSNALKQ